MVSIIIPVYNAKNTLETCVNSVLNQTYTNYEIVIVNDGSTDNSLEVIKKIAKEHSCVKYYTQNNAGVTAARKTGFKASNGEHIMFLDADDYLTADCLEVLMSGFKSNEIEVVNAGIEGVPNGRKWEHKTLGTLTQKEYLYSLLKGDTYGYLYASLYKRSVLKQEVFDIDASIKIGEDVLMKIYMCKYINKVSNIKNTVYKYVDNESSAMNTKLVHPDYYVRYIAIRNKIVSKIIGEESLVTIQMNFLNQIDANKMVTLFFNSLIPFEKSTYQLVKKYSVNATLKSKKILNSQILTIVLKGLKKQIEEIKCILRLKTNKYSILR